MTGLIVTLCNGGIPFYFGNLLSQRFILNEPFSDIQAKLLTKDTEVCRARLGDISWDMRTVN